jgi:hypothetical protein
MNLKLEKNKNLKTSQPTGGCRMRQARSFLLSLLAATFLIVGLSASVALAVETAAFTDSPDITVTLLLDTNFVTVGDSTYADEVNQVTAGDAEVIAYKFHIFNGSAVEDTLTSVIVTSFCDSALAGAITGIALVKGDVDGPVDTLASNDDPGDFVLGESITLDGFEDAINVDETTFYYILVDFADELDDSLHGLFAGVQILDSGLVMTLGGVCPDDPDTLRYADGTTDDAITGDAGQGRTLQLDLEAPDIDINFSIDVDNGFGCLNNVIVNIYDSIIVTITDNDGLYLPEVSSDWTPFGAPDDFTYNDSIGADPAVRYYGLTINPDSVAAYDGATDIDSGFFYFLVTATDEVGNTTIDSLLIPYNVDTKMPVIDDDTVWVELSYDANDDGIAAIGDTVIVHAYLTGEEIFEIEEVTADFSNWGIGAPITLEDQGFNRMFTGSFEIPDGSIDLDAEDSTLMFWVYAKDNACNIISDSALNAFAIDNEAPTASVDYDLSNDADENNIANIGDVVKITVDLDTATASDLATTCEVMVNLQHSGLGGSAIQCVETVVGDDYVYNHTIAYLPIYDQYAVDVAGNTHTVDVTLTDDAGNTNEITSSALLQRVDSKPPEMVELNYPTKGACAINLSWTGDADDKYYFIYTDGGDGVWSAADKSDSVGLVIYPDDDWSTDESPTLVVEDGVTYQFMVRTVDNADNAEYYTDFTLGAVSTAADCVAPIACVTEPVSGGSYGVNNDLDLVVIDTVDLDIGGVSIYVRDPDLGSGVVGDWTFVKAMTQVGSGGTFTATLDSADLDGFGVTSGYLDDTYELITVAADEWGNTQTLDEAEDACVYSSPFTFHWFWQALPALLVSVNDTISPQDPSCGFNVTRDDSNAIVIDVTDFETGDTFTVDVMAFDTGDEYRMFYAEDIVEMPYTIYLNCTEFPKGSQDIYITVTRNDGNETNISFEICVPDENAPMAHIVYPADNERVRRTCNAMNILQVWAQIDGDTYDPANVTRVEFEEALDTVWTRFDIVTAPDGGYYKADWYNCAYDHGDIVKLRAVFYDDYNNTFATDPVVVVIDTLSPDVTLSIPQAKSICGNDVVGGTIDLVATVNSSIEDIAAVNFYYCLAEDPDLVDDYYVGIGAGTPATSDGIYMYSGFGTDVLADGKYYRFRAIATDIAGNVMWDSDADGVFDDNTFDPATKNSDLLLMVDNEAIIPAISNAVVITGADTITFPNPSSELNGADRIYAVSGSEITVHSQPLPLNDTCGLFSVVYYWDDEEIGVGSTTAPYGITFDPVELGFINPEDIAEDYVSGTLRVEFTDMFGNTADDDITVYILDNTANQAVIFDPPNEACVSGEVEIYSFAVNDYDLKYVEYYYRAAGDTDWTYIGMSDDWENTPVIWNTVNAGIPDGEYELAAISVDESLNRDDNPAIITVTLANTFVEAEITEPAEDYVYIAEGALVKVEETSGTAKQVVFLTKPLNSDVWETFATDYEAPWEAEHDIDMIDGVCQIKARVYNCADEYKDTDVRFVYIDNVHPYAQLVTIAGYDVEGGNDPTVDLTGMTVVDVTGMFRDDEAISGFNSGIAKVAFYLTDESGTNVRVKIIDPATAGTHTAQFDISGLDDGTYYFACRAWDNVGNYTTSDEVAVTISDVEVPVTAIAGYYSGTLYGYDWSGDAYAVLFEYQSGDQWVGIGIGYHLENDIWYANWSPAPGTYTLRMKAVDEYDNYSETLTALTTTFTLNTDGTFSFGSTGLTEMAAIKNYDDYHLYGVVGLNSTLGEPFTFAVYVRNDGDRDYEVIDLKQNLDDDELYRGSFTANYIDGGGEAYIFSSAPSGGNVMIQQTWLNAYEVTYDLGSNGTVKGNNNTVSLTIPPGGANLVAFVLQTWMPDPSVWEQYIEAIGNSNGLANYIGCNDEEGYCYLDNDRYATITMPYDTLTTTPAESLVVGWWDGDEWRMDYIYQPVFNTTAHTVTFKTEQLFGLFAVLRYKMPYHPSPITIDFIQDSCGYYDIYPVITARVQDYFSGIDDDITVLVDGEPIILEGDRGNGYDYDYDDVTGLLYISWFDLGHYGEYDYYAEPLTCGPHNLKLIVWNNQAQVDTATFNFTVDCVAPTVVFENSYVSKNPTITFNVTDDLSGVDPSTIFVDVVAIQSDDTSSANPQQDEHLFFLQTFYPDQLTIDENGDVTITTTFELEDERAIAVIIYDGVRNGDVPVGDDYYYGYGWDEYYGATHGVHDFVGNSTDPAVQILAIDYDAPDITVLNSGGVPADYLPGVCPVQLQVRDDGSGIAATGGIRITENDELLTAVAVGEVDEEGEYSYDPVTGVIEYCPSSGVVTNMVVTDEVGNQTTRTFRPFNPESIVDATVNFNPWDPAKDGPITIDYNFAGQTAVKIYDFAGDLVKSMTSEVGYATWNGRTEDGTMVADGVYFAHIVAETTAGSYSTVVKIAIVEK